ncbi:unnamed protein product [Staurois parvus]|uniref:Uncharacterized protein n=1 Tax=Staurois parvus TaxID=386267 RepID=A0ABN9FWL1_9NEOB|nr:unnamed protein product [Staurois parvus]
MTPKGRGMMGLVVSQQLEGYKFETHALDCTGVKLAVLQLLPNYKSHVALQD